MSTSLERRCRLPVGAVAFVAIMATVALLVPIGEASGRECQQRARMPSAAMKLRSVGGPWRRHRFVELSSWPTALPSERR
jgi:hypothetical protein